MFVSELSVLPSESLGSDCWWSVFMLFIVIRAVNVRRCGQRLSVCCPNCSLVSELSDVVSLRSNCACSNELLRQFAE